MATVGIQIEDWRMLPWKKYQENVYRLQKRIYQAARRGDWNMTEDVLEVHHRDHDRKNNRRSNLALLHGHCHDQAHGEQYQ